jgi:hypothetical protein
MNLALSVKLVPLWYQSPQCEKKYVEQVIVFLDGYPSGMMHIDTFYGDRTGYDQLRAGLMVEGKLTITAADGKEG